MANGKFIAYYRVSTKKQGASGLGLEAQQADVQRYLNGGDWELLAEFTDIETGTRKGNQRPELTKALQACKRQKVTLVIAKLDRLARNVAFVSAIMEAGVEFVCVDNPHANRMTIQILAVMAEEEARAVSVRTKSALAAAKARGVQLGNPENLSMDARRQGAASRKQEAITAYSKLTHLVANLKEKGYSLAAIANHLNELGEVTRTGAAFSAMTVKRMLDRV